MGELHIIQPDHAVECPGRHNNPFVYSTLTLDSVLGDDDATDAQCTIKTVPNIFNGNILNHVGPYQGIYVGSIYCT